MNTRLVSIFHRFATLAVSMTIIGVGSMTNYAAQAASQSRPRSLSNGVTIVASPLKTKVVHFSPSGIRGTLDTPIDCQETSWVAPRPNAWRCIVKRRLYDPCFSTSSQADSVVCDADPISDSRGLKAMLAHPFPAEGPYHPGIQAWLMRLSDGAVCGFITGATGVIGGERLNYGCTNGWWVVGFPQIGSVWMVKTVKQGQPQLLRMMSVAEVWW